MRDILTWDCYPAKTGFKIFLGCNRMQRVKSFEELPYLIKFHFQFLNNEIKQSTVFVFQFLLKKMTKKNMCYRKVTCNSSTIIICY